MNNIINSREGNSKQHNMKTSKLKVNGSEISFFNIDTEDYISLTDIAKHKDATNTDDIIKNWLRNRNTI